MNFKEKYYFFLNPYVDCAFTKCPKCENKTKIKKLPLTIFMETNKIFLNLNKTCKFCPYCELIIVKKYELDQIIMQFLSVNKLNKNTYLVIGTQEKKEYLSALNNNNKDSKLAGVVLFKEVLDFKMIPSGWYPASK